MKILIVQSSNHGGGAERVAAVWADAFVRLGHEVVLAADKPDTGDPYVYPVNPKVRMAYCFSHCLHTRCRLLRTGYYYLRTTLALRHEIKRFRPDVAMGVMGSTSVQTLVAAIGTGCPVIATEHNSFDRPDYPDAVLTRRGRFYKFTANKWYPMVSVLTTADKEFIGRRLKNVAVMPNPLALQPLTAPHPARQKRIVAAGRLGAWHYKGFDVLIEAWGRVAEKHPDWTLDIAGKDDGQAAAYLQGLIDRAGLGGRCVLSGFHTDVARLYAESEIFVLSSRYEGFGMVLIEAMSQGCACIAADYKGRQREIMPTEDIGICVPPEDAAALAQAMDRVIADEPLRRKMQQGAILRARDYDSLKVARMWEEKINEIIKKKR